jgi:hypothetical protein
VTHRIDLFLKWREHRMAKKMYGSSEGEQAFAQGEERVQACVPRSTRHMQINICSHYCGHGSRSQIKILMEPHIQS